MIACTAASVDRNGCVWLCGACAQSRIHFGERRFPVCAGHGMIWEYGHSLQVLMGAAVVRLVPASHA